MELDNSVSHSRRILIGQLEVEAIRKLSQSCHKLNKNSVEVATARLVTEVHLLQTMLYWVWSKRVNEFSCNKQQKQRNSPLSADKKGKTEESNPEERLVKLKILIHKQ